MLKKSLILIYCIVYGSLAGVVFKVVACMEQLHYINQQFIWRWKKYPLRYREQFSATLLSQEISHADPENIQLKADRLSKHKPMTVPFLFSQLLIHSIIIIILIPYYAITGLVDGPLYIFNEYWNHEE